jgi:hypothetical protein
MPRIPDASSVTRLRAIQSAVVADPTRKSASYIPSQPSLLFSLRSSDAGRGMFPAGSYLSTPIASGYVNPRHQGFVTTSSIPPIPPIVSLTLSFLISSTNEQTLGEIFVKSAVDKSLDFTIEWDADVEGNVFTNTATYTLAPNSEKTLTDFDFDFLAEDVPLRIRFSDSSAVETFRILSGVGSYDDGYRITQAPTNLAGLTNSSAVVFEFQSVDTLNITGFIGNVFRWLTDTTIQSANLTNVNVNELNFTDCSSLTTLTTTGIVIKNDIALLFEGCALDEASVNALFLAADQSGATDGTLDVGGGTNASPVVDEELINRLLARNWQLAYNV